MFEWACRMIYVIIAIAPLVTVYVAWKALSQAREIADRQIKIEEREWIPRLMVEEIVVSKLDYNKKAKFKILAFHIPLKNAGKCDVFYEIVDFKPQVTYYSSEFKGDFTIRQPNKPSSCGVIPVNSLFSPLANVCYITHLNIDEIFIDDSEDGNRLVKFTLRTDFTINYWDIKDEINKRSLKYTIDLSYMDSGKWSKNIIHIEVDGIRFPEASDTVDSLADSDVIAVSEPQSPQ